MVDIADFKLKDSLYWPIGAHDNDKLMNHLDDIDFFGVILEGPTRIEIDKWETFPAIKYHYVTFKEAATFGFWTHGVFTLMDLNNNRLYIFKDEDFILDDDGGIDDDPDDDDSPIGDGILVDFGPMNLRDVLDLTWEPSKYILTTVMREGQSNRVVTELVKSDGSHKTPEFLALQKEKWEKTDPPPLYPGWGDHHSYGKVENSPDLPETSDIKIKVPSQIDLRTSENWIMNGSFRLPLRIQEIVKVKPDTPEKSDPEIKRPTAVKGIHLLLVREKDGEEQLFSFQIPSFDNLPEENQENQVITGHFNIDFLKLPRFSSRLQTYYLYAFSGDVMVGPSTTTLIRSEDPEEK